MYVYIYVYREFAYSLRVKLLEAVDSYKFVPIADNIIENDRSSSSSNDASGAAASLTGELNFEDKSHLMTFTETEDEWGDLLKENNPLPSHHTQIQHQQVHPEMQEVDMSPTHHLRHQINLPPPDLYTNEISIGSIH